MLQHRNQWETTRCNSIQPTTQPANTRHNNFDRRRPLRSARARKHGRELADLSSAADGTGPHGVAARARRAMHRRPAMGTLGKDGLAYSTGVGRHRGGSRGPRRSGTAGAHGCNHTKADRQLSGGRRRRPRPRRTSTHSTAAHYRRVRAAIWVLGEVQGTQEYRQYARSSNFRLTKS